MVARIEQIGLHKAKRLESIATDAVEALKALGGSAHFNILLEKVQAIRRASDRHTPEGLSLLLKDTLERFRQRDDQPEGQGVAFFYRPFGETSLRWALCRDTPAEMTTALERAEAAS